MNRSSILLILLILFIYAQPADAEPYDKSSLNVSYLHNTNRNLYHRYWKPANGFDFSFKTEFYLGSLEFGMGYSDHEGIDSDMVEYESYFVYAGWLQKLNVSERFSLFGGSRVGSYIMSLDDDHTSIQGRTETELGLEFIVGTEIAISDRFGLEHTLRHRIIYTRHKIRLTFLTIGLTYNFDTPDWLKRFLL